MAYPVYTGATWSTSKPAIEHNGMYEDYDNESQQAGHVTALLASASTTASTCVPREHDTQDRWQHQNGQRKLNQQQIYSELVISIFLASLIAALFWQSAPLMLIAGWGFAIFASIFARSLLTSSAGYPNEIGSPSAWGHYYEYGALASGICWGLLGVIAVMYGGIIHQVVTLTMLVGITFTANNSMQMSQKSLLAFVVPALSPIAAWFGYKGGTVEYVLLFTVFVIVGGMIFSSSKMHETLRRALKLSTYNKELIKKLVTTTNAEKKAKQFAERTNLRLKELISERKQAEEKTRASERRMSDILSNVQDTIYQTDMDGVILWATPSIWRLLGYDVEELLGRNIKEFYVSPDAHDELKQSMYLKGGQVHNFENRLIHKDGSHIWISENSHYRYDWGIAARGIDACGIEGTIRDTTALHKAREALQREKERAQVTLRSIGDGVITTDLDGNIEYMNTVAEDSTGWKLKDAHGKPILQVFKIIDEKSFQSPPNPCTRCLKEGTSITMAGYLLLIHRYSNKRLSIEVNASPIRDGDTYIAGTVLVFHNVTEIRGLAEKMSYQATHDSLTGLLNRREFENRLNIAIQHTCMNGGEHALCYLDLDNFKVVNDTCGHIAGDELLRQLTIKLRMELREADVFARLGGDEFGILLECCSVENAKEIAETIRRVVENYRFARENKIFRIGVSIGLVPINTTSGTMTEILSAADSACYVAKEQGRNRIHIYEPDDEAVAERHGQMQWVHRIQDVLDENRFRLFFQPIAKLRRGPLEPVTIHGEVLLRMLDEHNSLVGPGSFIPAAERYLLMPAIDRWVITNTFRMLALNKERVEEHVSTCSINLSGQSLSDERFMDFLVSEIRESGLTPRILCFEITETAVIANLSNAAKFISTLRAMGCRFALDDFGVGLSSFSYLKNLPVDYLKLDGCFVQNMVADNIDLAMVKAINQIGHTMEIKTIAEFVEDDETLDAVRSIGVDYAQGYVISEPVPIEIALNSDPADFSVPQVPRLKTVS